MIKSHAMSVAASTIQGMRDGKMPQPWEWDNAVKALTIVWDAANEENEDGQDVSTQR